MWVVEGMDSGELQEFKTKRAALLWIKEARRFDKENGLEGERWVLYEEP